MSFDASLHRRQSLEEWESAAPGWVRNQELVRRFSAPVSERMIAALSPQPGQRVLELAAGIAETGLLAAELVAPGGSVLITDQAEAMLAGARERAAQLGAANVEFQTANAESLDLPLASFDGVLCRWGYMLMADPPAALTETRRVLRPGGHVALAVWGPLAENPWAALPGLVLAEHAAAQGGAPGGGAPGSAPGPGAAVPGGAPGEDSWKPGPFALGDAAVVVRLLEDAGFGEAGVEPVQLEMRHPGFERMWETTLDISPSFHDAVMERSPAEIEQLKAALEQRLAPYRDEDGSITLPALTLVARASA